MTPSPISMTADNHQWQVMRSGTRTEKVRGRRCLPHCRQYLLRPTRPTIFQSPVTTTMIAKIARFEWEIPHIERGTRAYQLLEGSGLAPRFLAHIHENGRIMGLLLDKIEGRSASIQDLDICEAALGKLHELGFLHGNVNRCNLLVP
ncbi:uncharacterized protein BJX67DRAFT_85035 [Aspergillus lucknowensis]|uniref:Alpha-galactosidase A n=1 Tax=Aspergillus lucknowensis TaxID=176173 RepID=A0ABR4LTD4_9EURO